MTYLARALPLDARAVVQNAPAVGVTVAEVAQPPFPAEVKVVARGVAEATATRPVVAATVVHGRVAVQVKVTGRVTDATSRALVPIARRGVPRETFARVVTTATAEVEGQATVEVVRASAPHVTFLARAAVVRNLIPGQAQAHAVEANAAVDGGLAL